jgi:hypothetical protein
MNISQQWAKSALTFAIHQIVGTWGVAFIAAFGLTSLFDVGLDLVGSKPVRFAHWLLTENPFYPVQIVAGLYFGWLLSRRFRHRSMLWIWVLPLAVMCYALVELPILIPEWTSILVWPNTIQARLSYYFGWGCQPRDRCLDQLMITMPFYVSAAYSLGALLARKSLKKDEQNPQVQ